MCEPAPAAYANIFRIFQPPTIGFITYSEGCNDDVNKIVWSGLGWDPETPVAEILWQYSRYFIGDVTPTSSRKVCSRSNEIGAARS